MNFLSETEELFSGSMQRIATTSKTTFAEINGQFGQMQVKMHTVTSSVEQLNFHMEKLSKTRALSVKADEVEKANKNLEILDKKSGDSVNKVENSAGKIASSIGGMAVNVVSSGAKLAMNAAIAIGKDALKQGMSAEHDIAGLATFVGTNKATDIYNKVQQTESPYSSKSLLTADTKLISAGVDSDKAYQDTMNMANAVAAVGGNEESLTKLVANMQKIRIEGKATKESMAEFSKEGIDVYQLLANATGKPIDKVKDLKVNYDMLSGALNKASLKGGMYEGGLKNQSQTVGGKWTTLTNTVQGAEQGLMLSQAGNIKEFEDILITAAKQLPAMISQISPFITALFKEVKDVMPYMKKMLLSVFDLLKPVLQLVTSDAVKSLMQNIFSVSTDLLHFIMPAVTLAGKLIEPLAFLISKVLGLVHGLMSYLGFGDSEEQPTYEMAGSTEDMRNRVKMLDPRIENALSQNASNNNVVLGPYNPQLKMKESVDAAAKHDKATKVRSSENENKVKSKSGNINSGGVRSVTININKMIDSFTIHAQTINEGIDNLDNRVAESLLRVMYSAAKTRE